MPRFAIVAALLMCAGCDRELEHPAAAPACDPARTRCDYTPPLMSGPGSGSSEGGAGAEPALDTFSGRLLQLTDDLFDTGVAFEDDAQISAEGENGARVTAAYDGASFELAGVLKTDVNWFVAVPADGTGLVPTIAAVDTRSASRDGLVLAVAPALELERILQDLGSVPASTRAQVVLRVVDRQGQPVAGVHAALQAEVTAYRTAGTWLGNDAGTDESGLIVLGNVPASSELTRSQVSLSGAATGRVELALSPGATSVVTAVVVP